MLTHDGRRWSPTDSNRSSELLRWPKIFFSTPRHRSDKLIIKEGSTKLVNFMTPGAGDVVLRCGLISHIMKMHYQYTAYWLLLYKRIIMLFFYAVVDFYFFYDVAVDMQIWALLTRSQWRVSDDTRWPFRPVGLLLSIEQKSTMHKVEIHRWEDNSKSHNHGTIEIKNTKWPSKYLTYEVKGYTISKTHSYGNWT